MIRNNTRLTAEKGRGHSVNKIVRPIEACVGETVEIQWIRPGVVPVEKLCRRYTAPPVDTWQAIRDAEIRAAQPLIEDEWTPGGNQGVGI